jgi:hypothetical protein
MLRASKPAPTITVIAQAACPATSTFLHGVARRKPARRGVRLKQVAPSPEAIPTSMASPSARGSRLVSIEI